MAARLSTRSSNLLVLALAGLAVLAWAVVIAIARASIGSGPGSLSLGIDGLDYVHAAGRVLGGNTPYLATQLTGQAYSPILPGAFRYPPTFAQAMEPFALLPSPWGIGSWVALNAACYPLSAYLVLRSSGLPQIRRVILALLLSMAMVPVLWGAYLGNAGGVLALCLSVAVVTGPTSAFLSMGLAALAKITPVAALPALLLAGRQRVLRGILVLAALTAISVLWSPGAWRDFFTATWGGFGGTAFVWSNYAPANIVAHYLGSGLPYQVARALGLFGALILLVWSLRAGWRQRVPAALLTATLAGLLIPTSMWYHYLALLLPFAALALPALRGGNLMLWLAALLLMDIPVGGGVLVVPGAVLLVTAIVRSGALDDPLVSSPGAQRVFGLP